VECRKGNIEHMKKTLTLIALVVVSFQLAAQTADTIAAQQVQFSFCYPLGTNGTNSPSIENNFSLNALIGVNGGVNGFEMGGLVNVNNGRVDGCQLAGIANITTGSSNGVILSGIANVVADSSRGIFMAGISNVFSKGGFNGVQLAGISNLNNGNVTGLQVAGITNINYGDLNGTQLAGILNVVHGNVVGTQFGLINYAKNLRGFQLGFINIAGESEQALPFGFLSFVKNGYHAFDFSANEAIYGNVSFKLGVERFYNIFKIGFSSFNNESTLVVGYGVGTLVRFTDKHKLAIELSANNGIRSFNGYGYTDVLSRLDLNYNYVLGKHLSVFAGPSFNVYYTEQETAGNYGTLNVPYTIFEDQLDYGKLSMWFGFNAGLSVRF